MMPMEQQNPPNSTRATLRLGMSRPNVIRIPLHMVQQEAGSTARTALRDLWWFSWVKYFMEKHKLTDGLFFPPIIMEVKGNWYWRDPVSSVYVLFTSFRKDELKMFDFHLGRSYWTLTWCMKNDWRAMKGAMNESWRVWLPTYGCLSPHPFLACNFLTVVPTVPPSQRAMLNCDPLLPRMQHIPSAASLMYDPQCTCCVVLANKSCGIRDH